MHSTMYSYYPQLVSQSLDNFRLGPKPNAAFLEIKGMSLNSTKYVYEKVNR
jgi:hypothetical protein